MASTQSRISFFWDGPTLRLENRKSLKSFLESIFRAERTPLSHLNYIFTSDKKLLAINRDFLGHDYFTDIITFDLSDTDKKTAEIYISTDRVRDNARNFQKTPGNEIVRVMIHGILHLCGYGDKTKADKALMTTKEDFYLKKWLSKRST